MTNIDVAVILGGLGMIGSIWYYFFGANKEATMAEKVEGKQAITIVVEAAYIPDRVVVKKNIPVEITFERKDTGECTNEVVFDNLPTQENRSVSAQLPEGKKTVVAFTPIKKGEYKFVCGMGMVHGKLIVE